MGRPKRSVQRTANARLRALIDIGLEFASERDSDRRLQSLCASARDLFRATYVTSGLLDRSDRTVRHVVAGEPDADRWIKTGDSVPGILGTVVSERRALRGANPGGDPARLQLPLVHPEVHAFLAAPIASPAHVCGWICLVGNEGRTFTEDDEHLVMALSGQVGRIYELEHEIVERKQAESELRHERDRAQRYLDAAEVILLALDLDGRITLINRKGCELLGWTDRELIGRDWIGTCLPYRIREESRLKFHNLIGGDVPVVEDPVLTRSGDERLIEWHNRVLRDDAGHVVGAFSAGSDVTDRNLVVDAVRSAEERMRFALEAAGVGFWDMDYTSGVLRWSERIEAQYGLQPGTFGGSVAAFVERIHPDDRKSVLETIRHAMKFGADFSVLSRSIWPDGTVRWLSGAGRVHLGEHGEPVRGVGISMDVTERRTREDASSESTPRPAFGRR